MMVPLSAKSDGAAVRANIKQPLPLIVLQIVHMAVNNFWPVTIYSSISQHKLYHMDKKIYTLLTIFIIYFVTAVSMVLFGGAQKVLTAILFGGTGIVVFMIMFFIWMLNRKHEQ
jgi:cytosine/uracil/thiamine/allantoin permease